MNIILTALMGLAMAVAGWRHMVAIQASRASQAAWNSLRELKTRKELLRLITDHQPKSIFLIDKEGRIVFANKALGKRFNRAPEDIVNHPLQSLMGPERAEVCLQRAQEARSNQSPIITVDRTLGPAVQIIQSQYIPLPAASSLKDGILVIEDDITGLSLEQERRERTLRQVVRVMVALADRRDPDAVNHSMRVGKLSQAIAEQMKLEQRLVETAEIAGELMNSGKMLVPTEILTRPGPLSPDEIKLVRNAQRHAAELLSSIEFDGPVAETLLQVQERYDGTGWPDGWGGEDIIITARIVAVANVFVALTSDRAHRRGISPEAALNVLMGGAGTAYDRRVLVALSDYLHSEAGQIEWAPKPEPEAPIAEKDKAQTAATV